MRVSVVIPTFNRRATVPSAVESALRQPEAEEVIVVDDGSTDGTAPILQKRFGNRLRVLSTAHRGVSAARNHGVEQAHGEWIAFLDSDDLWLPGKLYAQLKFCAQHPETRICHTGEIWVRDGVRVNPCLHHAKPSGDIFVASLRRCLVSPSAVMLRRDLFERQGGFDESLPACEDYDLWLRIARTLPVGLIDEPLVVKYGGHSDQLSRRYWGMDRFRVAALIRLLAAGDLSAAQHTAVVSVVLEKCAVLAKGAAKRDKFAAAARYRRLATWAIGRNLLGGDLDRRIEESPVASALV